jgi:hypothetical protein
MQRTLAIAVALVPMISAAAAQKPVTFGCLESYGQQDWDDEAISDPTSQHFGAHAELVENEDLHFDPVRNPDRIVRIRALPSRSLAGFSARYGARRIRFFGRTTPSTESEPWAVRAADGHFYVELQNRSGTHSYYAIREPVSTTEDPSAYGRHQAEFDIFRATPDSGIPLVVLQTSTGARAGHAFYSLTTRHLIDFRHAKPRTVAVLECHRKTETVGTISWLHTVQFLGKSALACDWISQQQDFQCTRQRTSLTAWGGRTWLDRFSLIAGTALPLFDGARSTPPSPYEWAATLKNDVFDPAGKMMVFPAFGETFVLWTAHDRSSMLLASRSNTEHLWPRFLYVAFKGSVITQAIELPIHTLGPGNTRQREDDVKEDIERWSQSSKGALIGDPIRLSAKPLRSTLPEVHYFQVLLTEGAHRSLFWVGLDGRIEPHQGQALLVASDAAEYDGDRDMLLPPSAAKAEWIGGIPILATVDMEPARRQDIYEGGYYRKSGLPEECPSDVELGWSSEQGWLIHRKTRQCDPNEPVVRAITISDEGQVSVGPAKIFDDQ